MNKLLSYVNTNWPELIVRAGIVVGGFFAVKDHNWMTALWIVISAVIFEGASYVMSLQRRDINDLRKINELQQNVIKAQDNLIAFYEATQKDVDTNNIV